MAFWGTEFFFDGRSCAEFGLMVYEFGSTKPGDTNFASPGAIISDTSQTRYQSFFYGIKHDKPLEFKLVFGANPEFEIHQYPLDRMMIASISAWLTGHQSQKWLEICQPDMARVRYKCVISDLELVTYASMPWAFSCIVTCDSPYAYMYPQTHTIHVDGRSTYSLFNESSYNGYYYPVVYIRDIVQDDGDDTKSFSITNLTDNGRTLQLTSLPTSVDHVRIDNDHQIIMNDRDVIAETLVVPKGRMRGDVNGNGVIDADREDEGSDFKMAFSASVGLVTLDDLQKWCADTDGSGRSTASEAVSISSRAAGNYNAYTNLDKYENWTWRDATHDWECFIPSTLSDGYIDGLPSGFSYAAVDGGVKIYASNPPIDAFSVTYTNIAPESRNLYPYFNGVYLRLSRMENVLQFNGHATVSIICEFPIDVGG